MMNAAPTPSKRSVLFAAICAAALFALSFWVFYRLSLRPSSDISIHGTWASECTFSDLTSFFHHTTHFMWHVLVTLVLLIPGATLPAAAALVTALCKTAEYLLIWKLFDQALEKRFSGAAAALAALACVIAASLCVPFYNPAVYAGVGTPNPWHSPTQIIAMVWMLLCVPYTARCYDTFTALKAVKGDRATLPWREPLCLSLMLVASLFAKPTVAQVFIPAACLFFGAMWLRQPKSSRFFGQMLLCLLPVLVVIGLQYLYYFGGLYENKTSIVLECSLSKLKQIAIGVALIQAFPLYALFKTRKEPKNTLYWLALLMDAVGVVEYLLLGEGGYRASDGNFGWGMMGASLMIWAVALPRFIAGLKPISGQRTALNASQLTGLLLLSWHVISGVYYLAYLMTTANVL